MGEALGVWSIYNFHFPFSFFFFSSFFGLRERSVRWVPSRTVENWEGGSIGRVGALGRVEQWESGSIGRVV